MASTILWQHDCPGQVGIEMVDGKPYVVCYVEDSTPPGQRVTEGLRVLYAFDEGSGSTIHDVSGAGTPLDLTVDSDAAVSWIAGGGLSVDSSVVISSAGPATKLIGAIRASSAITIEAWIKPASFAQDGPARIISLSSSFFKRNFQLGQAGNLYDVRLRTTETTDNGRPSLTTALGSATANLTHIAYTREASGMARAYIDGVSVVGKVIGGDCSNWYADYPLVLANELIGDRSWLGQYHLVALFDRALSQAEITQNYQAGHRITT